jgi:hypothetical protein
MTISRLEAVLAFVICLGAGYLLADWWPKPRDPRALAQICARVDYINSMQENLRGQAAASEEVQSEFKALVEQCRTALRDRAEEND